MSTEEKKKKVINSPHEGILEDLFVAYFQDIPATEIARTFNVPMSTFYHIRRTQKWDERKKRLKEQVSKATDDMLIQTKKELITMATAVVKGTGSGLLMAMKEKKVDFKVNDWQMAVKTFLLLTGDVTERFGSGTETKHSELLQELAQELSPSERAVVLDISKKLKERMERDQREKEKALGV